jgi:hypothetical protein
MNFAASASPTWSAAPNGALIDSSLYNATVTDTSAPVLPDLSSQVSSYLALLPDIRSSKTLFVLNFGLWDIYTYASLSQHDSLKLITESIEMIFTQLDRIITARHELDHANHVESKPDGIQVVLSKQIDPSLLPGWRSLRPAPLAPTSQSEEQKNAVFLTDRFNNLLEKRISDWVKQAPIIPSSEDTAAAAPAEVAAKDEARTQARTPPAQPKESVKQPATGGKATDKQAETTEAAMPTWTKDVFYYDFAGYILDTIRELQMQQRQVSDHAGLGKQEILFSPQKFMQPCTGIEEADRCEEPENALWWDEWTLGMKMNKLWGEKVAEFIRGEIQGEDVDGGKLKSSQEASKKGAAAKGVQKTQ